MPMTRTASVALTCMVFAIGFLGLQCGGGSDASSDDDGSSRGDMDAGADRSVRDSGKRFDAETDDGAKRKHLDASDDRASGKDDADMSDGSRGGDDATTRDHDDGAVEGSSSDDGAATDDAGTGTLDASPIVDAPTSVDSGVTDAPSGVDASPTLDGATSSDGATSADADATVASDGAASADGNSSTDATVGNDGATSADASSGVDGSVSPDGGSQVDASCPYSGPPLVDTSTLPPCAACGGMHCVPASSLPVPLTIDLMLGACDPGNGQAGLCAPDPVIQSGDNFVPKACTSIAGAEGRCLSTCLPLVASEETALPVDVCQSDERCEPCFDPTSIDPTAPTGACSIACDLPTRAPVHLTCPWTGPAVFSPSSLPQCGCSGAHCLPGPFVSPLDLGLFETCAGGYCVPDTYIAAGGETKPPSCVAFAGEPAAEGRCLSDCMHLVASSNDEVSTCGANAKCASCYDPMTGHATGACSTTSCDAPANPPYTYQGCCANAGVNEGSCVVKSQLPTSEQANLMADSCTDTNTLCVPTQGLPGGPGNVACTVAFVPGTCLSPCLNVGSVVATGLCSGNLVCVPCEFAPAGSQGC